MAKVAKGPSAVGICPDSNHVLDWGVEKCPCGRQVKKSCPNCNEKYMIWWGSCYKCGHKLPVEVGKSFTYHRRNDDQPGQLDRSASPVRKLIDFWEGMGKGKAPERGAVGDPKIKQQKTPASTKSAKGGSSRLTELGTQKTGQITAKTDVTNFDSVLEKQILDLAACDVGDPSCKKSPSGKMVPSKSKAPKPKVTHWVDETVNSEGAKVTHVMTADKPGGNKVIHTVTATLQLKGAKGPTMKQVSSTTLQKNIMTPEKEIVVVKVTKVVTKEIMMGPGVKAPPSLQAGPEALAAPPCKQVGHTAKHPAKQPPKAPPPPKPPEPPEPDEMTTTESAMSCRVGMIKAKPFPEMPRDPFSKKGPCPMCWEPDQRWEQDHCSDCKSKLARLCRTCKGTIWPWFHKCNHCGWPNQFE